MEAHLRPRHDHGTIPTSEYAFSPAPGPSDSQIASLNTPKGEIIDNEVQRIVQANLQAVDSIMWATEAGRRQIEQAASASGSRSNGSEGGKDARLSLALRELALENLEAIQAECDNLASASKRAVSISEGKAVDPAQLQPKREPRPPSIPGSPPVPPRVSERSSPGSPGDTGGLRPLLQAISAHRRIVVLTTLTALLSAVAFLAVRQPTYEATANVLVQPVPPDDPTFLSLGVIRDSGDPIRTTQTAATLLDSTEAADRTATALGGDWTSKKVQDSVEVAPLSENSIIAITASAPDAQESALLADTFAKTSLAARDRLLSRQVDEATAQTNAQLAAMDPGDPNAVDLTNELNVLKSIKQTGDPSLELQQAATVPDAPTNPGPAIVLALALIAGLALGSGGALLREFFGRRIADADEAAALYPMSVLARVPLLPAKSLEVPEGTAWYMPPEVREAFLTLAIQLEQRDRPPASLMITSPTRGDGKTTSAINLAVTLARAGRSVVLLDLDLRNPQVGQSLGLVDVATSLRDLANPSRDVESFLVRTDLPTLRILPVRADRGGDPTRDIDAARLRQLIRQARSLADCVVVDTPPLGEVSDALTLTREIEDILIVMRPGNTTRSHLQVMSDLLERTGHQPEGSIMIDASDRASGGYHSSGYGVRRVPELVVGKDPRPPVAVSGTRVRRAPRSRG